MTSPQREWTIEELDRVHPLPDGWAWRLWDGGPMACSGTLEISADGDEVWGQGRESNMTALPSKVCLAVILASQGLDSREAMATVLDGVAREIEAGKTGQRAHDGALDCAAAATMRCAAIVRRGRVG
jgi:hypothetical protein